MIIVPGNHDVSFPAFHSSVKKVEYDETKWGELVPRLFERDSQYRWSWLERALYEIHDRDAYRRRLERFSLFYRSFYQGQRTFPLDPSRQFEIFDYEDLMLTLVGYSSCYTNDPWHRLGNIHSEALAASFRELRARRYSGRALVGVWHHSVSAPPHKPDFMDEERVQLLLAHGFTLGLHGHQHRPERIRTSSRFGLNGRITVISAGTLCGGPSSLPTGRTRSFNVISLDVEDRTGHVQVMNMVNDELDLPIWSRKITEDGEAPPEFTISRSELAPPSSRQEVVSALTKAQALITSSDYNEAFELLLPYVEDGLARRLLLEASTRLDASEEIARSFNPPRSNAERIYLMDAFWELGDRDSLSDLLRSPEVANSVDASIKSKRDTMIRKLLL